MGFREALALGLLALLGFVVVVGAFAGELNYNAALTVIAPLIGVVYGLVAIGGKGKDDDKP